jgi:hypothetical protein
MRDEHRELYDMYVEYLAALVETRDSNAICDISALMRELVDVMHDAGTCVACLERKYKEEL